MSILFATTAVALAIVPLIIAFTAAARPDAPFSEIFLHRRDQSSVVIYVFSWLAGTTTIWAGEMRTQSV
jgi:hypothetical protein